MDRVELSIDGTGYLSSLRFFSSLLPHLAPLHSHLNFSLFLSFFFFAYPFQIRINFYHSRYKYLETIKRKRIVVEKYINFVKYVLQGLPRSTQTKNTTRWCGERIYRPFRREKDIQFSQFLGPVSLRFSHRSSFFLRASPA